MKSRNSTPTLLFVLIFAFVCAGTASLTVWAAESTASESRPAKGKNRAKKAETARSNAAAGDKVDLAIKVDRKPINRDAADRVSYAPIVKRTAASVVYVYSTKTVRAQDMSPFFNDPMLRRFFDLPGMAPDDDENAAPQTPRGNNRNRKSPPGNSRNRAPERQQQGLGSGVVFTTDGYLLTNHHVIDEADEIRVSIGDSNKRYEARVIGRDPGTDLAVLKIDAADLTPATFGDSDQLEVGDVVLAIGNPFGVGQSVSRGIVSALGRGVGMGTFEDFIQTDAAINPGNSGGALMDTEGRLVGVNTAILSRSGGFAGVGFAIPANLARNVAEQLVRHGRVERGFLGVRPQDLTEDLSAQFGAERGALISQVTEQSPAERAGLKAGDVITKVNDTEIRDARHLLMTISQIAPGSEITLTYVREAKTATARTTLDRRDEEALARDDGIPTAPKDEGILNGVAVSDLTQQLRDRMQIPSRIAGAIVTSVDPDTPAARQGLREGDVILELDRRPVRNAEEAVKLSEEIKGPKFLVLVWRSGRTSYLVIDESKE